MEVAKLKTATKEDCPECPDCPEVICPKVNSTTNSCPELTCPDMRCEHRPFPMEVNCSLASIEQGDWAIIRVSCMLLLLLIFTKKT